MPILRRTRPDIRDDWCGCSSRARSPFAGNLRHWPVASSAHEDHRTRGGRWGCGRRSIRPGRLPRVHPVRHAGLASDDADSVTGRWRPRKDRIQRKSIFARHPTGAVPDALCRNTSPANASAARQRISDRQTLRSAATCARAHRHSSDARQLQVHAPATHRPHSTLPTTSPMKRTALAHRQDQQDGYARVLHLPATVRVATQTTPGRTLPMEVVGE